MMGCKISVTTNVTVKADTIEEAREICRQLAHGLPSQHYPQLEAPSEEPQQVEENKAPSILPAGQIAKRAKRKVREVKEALAESRANEGQVPISTISAGQENASPRLLGQAVETFLDSLEAGGSAKATLDSYSYYLGHLVSSLSASQPVDQIGANDIISYLAALHEKGLRQSTIKVRATVIKSFFRWLVERGELKANPMLSIKVRMPRWNPVPPFSDEDIQRLLKACETPMERAVIELLLDTGLRASELTGLRLDNFNLSQSEFRVLGKGGKVRTLALNERPMRALWEYLKTHSKQDGLIWPKDWNKKHLARLLTAIGKRADIKRVFPHRFRHTFASRFLRETGDAMALQALMGHSSLMMVQRYIAAAQGEMAVKAHREHSPMDALRVN